nr:hypothetical protein [Acrocarpospora corrugata]
MSHGLLTASDPGEEYVRILDAITAPGDVLVGPDQDQRGTVACPARN